MLIAIAITVPLSTMRWRGVNTHSDRNFVLSKSKLALASQSIGPSTKPRLDKYLRSSRHYVHNPSRYGTPGAPSLEIRAPQ